MIDIEAEKKEIRQMLKRIEAAENNQDVVSTLIAFGPSIE